jgi:hypothetical protein
VPASLYAFVVWHRFDHLLVTYYVPYEALISTARDHWWRLSDSNLLEFTFTSGELIVTVFAISVARVFDAAATASLLSLLILSERHSALTSGGCLLVAPVNAIGSIQTTLLGCCAGAGMPGALIALALGISAPTAALISGWMVWIEPIFLLVLALVSVHRRFKVETFSLFAFHR